MKHLITVVLFSFFITLANAQHEGHNMPAKKEQTTTKEIYTCPMHPEVQSDKPGKCPKCGMNLEKKKIKVAVKPMEQKASSKPAENKNGTRTRHEKHAHGR